MTPKVVKNGEMYFTVTYFLNVNLSAKLTPGGLPLAAFVAPANTMLLGESMGGGLAANIARLNDFNEAESVLANYFVSITAAGANRHEGGHDFLLADGHVKWLRPEAVSNGSTLAAADTRRYVAQFAPTRLQCDFRVQERLTTAFPGQNIFAACSVQDIRR